MNFVKRLRRPRWAIRMLSDKHMLVVRLPKQIKDPLWWKRRQRPRRRYFPRPAAAIAQRAGASGSFNAASGALTAFSCQTGDVIVVVYGIRTITSTGNAPTDTIGNTYTQANALNNTAIRCEVWTAVSTGSNASNVITAHLSATSKLAVSAESYSGALGGVNSSNIVTSTQSTANPTQSLTLTSPNNWFVAGFAGQGSVGPSVATAGNLRQSGASSGGTSSTNAGEALGDNTAASASSVTVTLTWTLTLYAMVGVELLLNPKTTTASDGDADQTRWTDWAAATHDVMKTEYQAIPPPLPPTADPGRFAIAPSKTIVGDVIDFGLSPVPATFPDLDSDQLWRDWRAFQYEDTDTENAYEPSRFAPTPPLGDEPDDRQQKDSSWRAFQYYDEETQRELPPPPPTTYEPEEVSKWDATWRAFQHEDTDTQSAFPIVTVVTPTVPPDEISERWSDWRAFQPDDETLRILDVPDAGEDAAAQPDWDELSKFDAGWQVKQYEDVETQSAFLPGTPPLADPARFTLAEDEVTVGDVLDFGFATAPTVNDEEFHPWQTPNFAWLLHDDTETQSNFPIVVAATPKFGIEDVHDRWTDWRALAPEDDLSSAVPTPPFSIPDLDSDQRWADWRVPQHEDLETQMNYPPFPPKAEGSKFALPPEATRVGDVIDFGYATGIPFATEDEFYTPIRVEFGWMQQVESEENSVPLPVPATALPTQWGLSAQEVIVGDVIDFGFATPPTIEETELYQAQTASLWFREMQQDDSAYPIVVAVVPFIGFEEVSEKWSDWRAIDDLTSRMDEPGFIGAPAVAIQDAEETLNRDWRGLQPDDDQPQFPTAATAIDQDGQESRWSGWSAPAIEDDWTTAAPTPPFAIQDAEDTLNRDWRAWLHEDTDTQTGSAPTPPTVQQEEHAEQKFVGWQVWQPEDETYRTFPPTPPEVEPETADDQEALSQISGMWLALQPEDVDTPFVSAPPLAQIDEVSDRWADWRQVWQEDVETQRAFPPTPPFVIQEEPIEKLAAWSALIVEDDWTAQAVTPPPTIQDEISERWADWRVPQYDDLETQSEYPIVVQVVPFIGFEEVSERWADWRGLQPDDDQVLPPTPPFSIIDDSSDRWAGWWALQPEDFDTPFVSAPPFAIDQDSEAAKWVAWSAVYDAIAEADEPGFLGAPAVAIQDEISERWADWRSFEPDDDQPQAPNPPFAIDQDSEAAKWAAWSAPAIEDDWTTQAPTPPEVEPETADDQEAMAQISGLWRAMQPDDDQAFAPAPPFAIPQDAEESKWVGWFAVYDHIADTDEPGFLGAPPVSIQEEHVEQKWVDWIARQYIDEETQMNYPPAPPTAQEPEDISKWDATWRAFNPEEIDNTKTPPPPPVITEGYIDDEFHAKALDLILKYYEDDWRALPPTPPTTFEPDEVSKWDATWRAFQLYDEETQRELPPTPPVSFEPDEASKWDATWRAFQYYDEETQRALPPTPPATEEPEDVSKFDAGWFARQPEDETYPTFPPAPPEVEPETADDFEPISYSGWWQLWHEDTETQRVLPPTPPTAHVPDDISKFDAGWFARQYEDTDTQRGSAPTPPATEEPEDVSKFDAGWSARQPDDETLSAAAPTPPFVQLEESVDKYIDWVARQYEDTETQRVSPPTPPETYADEITERWSDWSAFQPEDVDQTKTPPAPFVFSTIGRDDLESWFKVFEAPIPYHEDDMRVSPPTPPATEEPEDVSKWDASWRALIHEDTDTQRTSPPSPPTTFQEEPIERTFDWRFHQATDEDTQDVQTPTPPVAIEQEAIDSKFFGVSAPAIEDDWTTEAPPPPTTFQEEPIEKWADWRTWQPEDVDFTKPPPPPTVPTRAEDDILQWYKPVEVSYAPWVGEEFDVVLRTLGWMLEIEEETAPRMVAMSFSFAPGLVQASSSAQPALVASAVSAAPGLVGSSSNVTPNLVASYGFVAQNEALR